MSSQLPAVSGDPYLTHRDTIERAIEGVCRRHRLSVTDAEDFASTVRLRLIDKDHAVLRGFQGRSRLETYLAAVVTHALQDWRNAKWGKWRPSAEARRLGPVAIQLETLLVRDECSFDHAVEQLRALHGITEPQATLEAMVARLPPRVRRRQVADTALETVPAENTSAEDVMAREGAAETARRISTVLGRSMAVLADQDRLILRLHFEDGRTIADISRLLGLDQKSLYRRLTKLLGELRASLEAAGLTSTAAADALQYRGFDAANLRDASGKFSNLSVFSIGARRRGTANARTE